MEKKPFTKQENFKEVNLKMDKLMDSLLNKILRTMKFTQEHSEKGKSMGRGFWEKMTKSAIKYGMMGNSNTKFVQTLNDYSLQLRKIKDIFKIPWKGLNNWGKYSAFRRSN